MFIETELPKFGFFFFLRFVRFVSTPEVLERVNTIESEILQIDEAIAVQGNDSIGFGTVSGSLFVLLHVLYLTPFK